MYIIFVRDYDMYMYICMYILCIYILYVDLFIYFSVYL